MKTHRASKIRDDGRVSALCFKRPRAIDLQVASWTINAHLVTCLKCKRLQASAEWPAVLDWWSLAGDRIKREAAVRVERRRAS